jgi:hypothetical protein
MRSNPVVMRSNPVVRVLETRNELAREWADRAEAIYRRHLD